MKDNKEQMRAECAKWVTTKKVDRVTMVMINADVITQKVMYQTEVDVDLLFNMSMHPLVLHLKVEASACLCFWEIFNEKGALHPCNEHIFNAVEEWAKQQREQRNADH